MEAVFIYGVNIYGGECMIVFHTNTTHGNYH